MKRRHALFALVPFCAGCYAHHQVPLESLRALDGYPSGAQSAPRLQDKDGHWFDFDGKSHLALSDARTDIAANKLTSVRLKEDTLDLRLADGSKLDVLLTSTGQADISRFSAANTAVVSAVSVAAFIASAILLSEAYPKLPDTTIKLGPIHGIDSLTASHAGAGFRFP